MKKITFVLTLGILFFHLNLYSQSPSCIDNTCGDILANWGFADQTQTVFCEGTPVELVNLTNSPNIQMYIWYWGDGTIDTLFTDANPPAHTYNFPIGENCPSSATQVMDVSLEIFSTCGDGQSCHYQSSGLAVKYKPRAEFNTQSTICQGDLINFSDESCFADSWSWNFGDGNTSNEQNPSHTFNNTGTYTITLTATNDCGSDTHQETINVISYPDAEATYTLDPLSGLAPNSACAPATINLQNNSVPGDTYNWEVLLGSSVIEDSTTTATTPLEVPLNNDGTYNITLTASNVCGEDSWTETIEVLPSSNVILDDISPQCENFTFNAADYVEYIGQIDDVTWTFTGGSPSSSTEQFPTVSYNTSGTFTISVSINGCGTSTITKTITFQIDDLITPTLSPVADICFSADTITLNAMPSGGTWSGPGIVGDDGFFPGNANIGPNTLTYTYGSGACSGSENMDINVIDTTALSIDNPNPTVCVDAGIVPITATPSGGTWSGNGVSSDGNFDPSIVGSGNTSNLTYEFTNGSGCISVTNTIATVEGLPTALLNQDTISFCESPNDIDLNVELGLALDPGFSDEWTGPCVSADGIFNPACAGQGFPTLQYIVYTPNSCSDTTEITVNITPFVPAAAMDDFSECVTAGDMITLTATPPGGTWSGTNVSPDGTITLDNSMDGDYTYNYTIFPNSSCEDTDNVVITFINLNGITAPSLSYCETEGNVPLPDGNPSGGTWSYNGNNLNGSLNIQDFTPGNYTLQYEVESSSTNALCQASVDVPLFIDGLPVPDIIIPDEFCINEADTIMNNTTESYTSWSWDFGNGSTSTAIQPVVTYTNTGDYTITLIIQDTICSDTFSWMTHVSSPPPPLDFSMTLSATDSCEILTASFINTSVVDTNVSDVTYLWDYGNGQTDTTYSINETPLDMDYDAFDDDTIYYITLTALSSCGEAEVIGFDSIYVKPMPVSGFGAQFETYCSGAQVQFVNSSVGNPDNSIIDLGDGSPLLYDYPNDTLTHQYWTGDEPDTIYVTFISSNECGIDTIIDTIQIIPVQVVAGFTTEGDGTYCAGLPICLQNVATPGAEVWYDMGDGTLLFANDTCYTYEQVGPYIITQYALDICGGMDTMQTPILIIDSPNIGAIIPANVCFGDSISFTGIVDNDVVNVNWDFGDGSNSSDLSPEHLYDSVGIFDVQFTGSSIEACPSDTMTTVTVLPPPTPTFNFTDSLCLGDAVVLENTSPGIISSCLWTMDDGASYTSCNASHIFMTTGVHTIALTVTNENGCSFTSDTVVYIRPTPSASFIYNPIDICHPATFEFINTSSDGNTSLWDFGDGSGNNPMDSVIHVFDNSGSYTISLISSFDGICFDTTSQDIEAALTPMADFSMDSPQGCEPFSPSINNLSQGNNMEYTWNYSDGTTSFDTQPNHTFYTDESSEIFDIELIVVDSITLCADTTNLSVTVFDSVQIELLATDILCNGGQEGSINSVISGGLPNYQYNWSDGTNNTSISDLSAGTYSLTVTDANGCSQVEESIIIEPLPINIILEELADATCAGNTNGFIDVVAEGGTTNTGNEYTYDWNIPNPNSDTDLLSNLDGGTYIVTVTDENGCTQSATYEVQNGYELVLSNTVTGITCEGDTDGSIIIDNIDNGIPVFNAFLSGVNNDTLISEVGYLEFNQLPPGNYSLMVIDSNQCVVTEEYFVPDWQDPYVEIIADDSIFRCQDLRLIALGNASGGPEDISYSWFPDVDISCLDCDSVIVSPEIDITYEVTLTDAHGCTASDETDVFVTEDRTFYIPNTFSPNGDGENDLFRIRVGEHQEYLLVEVSQFTILDRWGNVMYSAPAHHPYFEPNVGWKGFIDGIEAPPGMYSYWAEYLYCDGEKASVKGLIQLVR